MLTFFVKYDIIIIDANDLFYKGSDLMKIGNLECYGIIYKITNKINNKVYIGQTKQGFNLRYNHRGKGAERVYNYHKYNKSIGRTYNPHLLNSMEKYGVHNFNVIEILDVAFSKDELNMKEKIYIDIFNSFYKGYNFTKGGDGTVGLSGEKHGMYGKGYKLKGSKNGMYGVQRFGKSNPMFGVSRFGRENPMYGKTHTEETRKKMSQNHVDVSGANNPRAKRVICVTTNKVFDTIKEAAKFYNIKSKSGISACCKGGLNHCGKLPDGTKLKWKYCEE